MDFVKGNRDISAVVALRIENSLPEIQECFAKSGDYDRKCLVSRSVQFARCPFGLER